jgi:hypothetical protein
MLYTSVSMVQYVALSVEATYEICVPDNYVESTKLVELFEEQIF